MKDKIKKSAFEVKKKFKKLSRDLKPHYKTVGKYWVQKISFKDIDDRLDLFLPECKGKDVLHFGCTDWPVFNPENNLHITLAQYTKTIDGFDIDKEGIEELRKYVAQDYYTDFDTLSTKHYDVCLIPETIEHVDNVQIFLKNLSKVHTSKFLITAPNCFSKLRQENYNIDAGVFTEVVHPDHNAWYSPYTLKNVIEKYSDLTVTKVYLLQNRSMICCEAVKSAE